MARTPRRDGLERREAILDAALGCFARRGVLATGIEDVRAAAKASPSSIYHHFEGGLAGIIFALLERTFARLFAHLTREVLASRSEEAAVHALVRGHLDWCLAHRDEARFMYQATALEHDRELALKLQARKAELLGDLVAHIGTFVARGEIPRWEVQELDMVLLGPSHEALRRHFAGAELDVPWLVRTLPAVAWKSVAPKAKRTGR
jgi:AcrR family transcriptional regulator